MNPIPSNDLSLRFLKLPDGRPGLRTTMSVDITEPSVSLSPSHGERVGERGRHETQSFVTGSPLPSDGRGARGEGFSSIRENSCNSCESSSENPCLDFISSDESLDRYDEIIVASGWKLSTYHRNPVFQNAHQYGDIIFTLGRALVTEVRAGKLYQRVQFATDVNPMARIAHGLYKGKFLNAVSVGFIPLRWQDGTKDTPYRRRFLEQELLEVSAVAIPANPNALALGLKSGAIEKSDLRDLSDLLRHVLSPSAPVRPPTSDLRLQTSDLLALAHALHSILKHT